MKARVSRSVMYSRGVKEPSYWFHVYVQPWYRYWLAAIYHDVWEASTWRLYRRLERFLNKRHKHDEFYIPLTNRQDLKCHDLRYKDRKEIAKIEVEKPVYESLGKRHQ